MGAVYRKPNSNRENGEKMIAMIAHASYRANNILILGDFNLPSISWETGDVGNRFNNGYNTPLHFLGTLQSSGLFQHVTQNTRARGSNATKSIGSYSDK